MILDKSRDNQWEHQLLQWLKLLEIWGPLGCKKISLHLQTDRLADNQLLYSIMKMTIPLKNLLETLMLLVWMKQLKLIMNQHYILLFRNCTKNHHLTLFKMMNNSKIVNHYNPTNMEIMMFILDVGKMELDMVEANYFYQQEHFLKVILKMVFS